MPTQASRTRTAAWWLLATGVAAFMVVSAPTLFALGIPYDAPVGPFWAKLHPGTYLVSLAFFLALASHGNPVGVALRHLLNQPLMAGYLACTVLLGAWAVGRHGTGGAAFLVDTHMMAAVSVLTLLLLQPQRHRQMLALMAWLLVANAMLGVAEAALQWRLVPLRVAGAEEVAEDHFRASALMGHPLANAQVTATLLPVLLLIRMPAAVRVGLVLWLALALLAFGGRTSFVLAMALYGAWFGLRAGAALLKGQLNYLQVVGGAIGLLLGAAAMVAVVAGSGLGERIFQSLEFDNSAQVRLRIWSILDHMSDEHHFFGMSPQELEVAYLRIGLQPQFEAIENFWLLIYVQYGLVGFVMFTLAMGCALTYAWRRAQGAFRVALVLMLLVASTTNSLASKTTILAPFMVAVAAAAHLAPRRRQAVAPRRQAHPWAHWAANPRPAA